MPQHVHKQQFLTKWQGGLFFMHFQSLLVLVAAIIPFSVHHQFLTKQNLSRFAGVNHKLEGPTCKYNFIFKKPIEFHMKILI